MVKEQFLGIAGVVLLAVPTALLGDAISTSNVLQAPGLTSVSGCISRSGKARTPTLHVALTNGRCTVAKVQYGMGRVASTLAGESRPTTLAPGWFADKLASLPFALHSTSAQIKGPLYHGRALSGVFARQSFAPAKPPEGFTGSGLSVSSVSPTIPAAEPTSLVLLGSGLIGIAGVLRHKLKS